MTPLDDRNKALLAHYPELSANWLTNGKGPMFLNTDQKTENSMENVIHRMKVFRNLMEEQVDENLRLRTLFSAGKEE
jgi:hypothetical protein